MAIEMAILLCAGDVLSEETCVSSKRPYGLSTLTSPEEIFPFRIYFSHILTYR